VFTNVMNPRSHVSRKHEYRPTLVRRGSSIGANATIVCGVTLGEYAFIGAGAVVTSDVPAYAVMVGVPARRVGWMCQCGERLSVAAGKAACPVCGTGYEEASGALRPVAQPHRVGCPVPRPDGDSRNVPVLVPVAQYRPPQAEGL